MSVARVDEELGENVDGLLGAGGDDDVVGIGVDALQHHDLRNPLAQDEQALAVLKLISHIVEITKTNKNKYMKFFETLKLTFRQMSRTYSFAQIVRECGIGSTRAFRLALFGRLRDELLRRGWSRAKIDAYMTARVVRVAA